MRERNIEEYLRDEVRKVGGRAYKFVSPGNNGVPDRIVMLPDARDVFVELKAPGRKPTPLQIAQHEKLRRLGRDVRVIDSKQGVDQLIEDWRSGRL